jgi:hypothetical protein
MSKIIAVAIIVASPFCIAQRPTTSSQPITAVAKPVEQVVSARLPLKRVVLYKSGIGYFEHTGRVSGNEDIHIDFTTGQLNDALKSLTAVDLNGGHIGGIRYDSLAPVGYRLKSLRLPLEEQTSRSALLNALRGARVQMANGHETATGRVFSVEKETRSDTKNDQVREVTIVSLFADSGEMRTFELTPSTSVRILDRDLSSEVGSYLNLIGSSRDVDLRRMTISTLGSGERNLMVSYISEVPVWKSTYRILLPNNAAEKPLLQGWAIVDNTIGEDWKNVEISLIAGAPQSFVQAISRPFYVRRPEVGLPESYLLTPQTHEGTLQAPPPPPPEAAGAGIGSGSLRGVVTDPTGAVIPGAIVTVRNENTGEIQTATTNAQGIYNLVHVRAGNSMVQVSSAGFQRFQLSNVYLGNLRTNEINARLNVASTSETVEVTGSAPSLQTESAMVSSVAAATTTKDLGDLFEYDLKQKVTIGKNQSALIPILQSHIDAEKITLWNSSTEAPLRSLWIKNSSGLTLDGGTFNVLENDTFAGEGLIDPVKPDEKRIISYAADQGIRITTEGGEDADDDVQHVTHLRIAKGIMTLTTIERSAKTYLVHDSDSKPRTLIIEHPRHAADWKLEDNALKPDESTATYHRFRLNVEAGKDAKLIVNEVHPESSEVALTNIDDEQVALWVEQKTITPVVEQAFRRILEKKSAISELDVQSKAKQQEIDMIVNDQNRLRENMKALKGSAEEKSLLQRYTRQLDTQEDRLAALRADQESLKAKRLKLNEELILMVQNVAIDENVGAGTA